jgi:SP family arabinose:H+ symporter-like MFS transporter
MTDKNLPTKQNKSFVYLISIIVAIGGFNFGFDVSIISGAIIFMKPTFNLNAAQVGFTMSSALLGCLVGPLFASLLCDKMGRKKTLIVSCIIFGASAFMTAVAGNIIIFNIFRFATGLGVGLTSMISPMYIAEVAPAKIRGKLVTFNQVAVVFGLFMAIVVSYLLSFSGNWRWMFAAEAIAVFPLLVGLFFIPESPRWLVSKKLSEKAMHILTLINGAKEAETEMKEIAESNVREKQTGSFRDAFKPGIRTALFVGIGLAFFQQFTGASIVLLYAPTIFQSAGFTNSSDAIFQSIIVAGWLIICTIVALWGVDKYGRKPLLHLGTLGMTLGMLLLGFCFYFSLPGIYTLFMVMLIISAYSISLAALTWLIISEIFPNHIRGVAMGIATTVVWFSSYLTSQLFPIMTEFTKNKFGNEALVFWFFSFVCIISFLFCWRLVPETKGRTLEEIGKSW